MRRLLTCARGGAAALFLLAVAGCPEETTTNPKVEPEGNSTPLTAFEICTIHESHAQFGSLCSNFPLKTGADLDAEELARSCRPGTGGRLFAEDLLDSLAGGRVSFDWVLTHECLDASRAMRSGGPGHSLVQDKAWATLRDGACTEFFKGVTPDGEFCKEDWDCLEGSACASDSPFSGTAVCLKNAGVDEACGDWHFCADGLYCDSGSCLLQKQDGGFCDPELYGDDCLSASCSDSGRCDPSPPPTQTKEFGEPCIEDEECGGSCAKCRADSLGGPKSCQVLGAAGNYCRDWMDCLDDLGCSDGVCGTATAGAICGNSVETLCDPGLYCLPTVPCGLYNGDEVGCGANSPTCQYDADYGECTSVQGVCTLEADLPASGACLHDYICALSSYCDAGTTTCQPLASEGDLCSEDGVAAPFCTSPLACVASACTLLCEYNEDCTSDEYCDDAGFCQPRVPFSCTDDVQCPGDHYCRIDADPCAAQDLTACDKISGCAYAEYELCEFASDCAAYSDDGAACQQQPGCRYDVDGASCAPSCYWFDGDAEGCAQQEGCAYLADYDYCDPSCAGYDGDEQGCSAIATCSFEIVKACELVETLAGSCTAQLDTGVLCESGAECLSGDCSEDPGGDMRCAVQLSGCDRDAGFVREAFLFGFVFVFGRRLRRRR